MVLIIYVLLHSFIHSFPSCSVSHKARYDPILYDMSIFLCALKLTGSQLESCTEQHNSSRRRVVLCHSVHGFIAHNQEYYKNNEHKNSNRNR